MDSKVILWFSVSGASSYKMHVVQCLSCLLRKILIVLQRKNSMLWCSWVLFDWRNDSNMTQKASLEASRGSPKLCWNRSPCSVECETGRGKGRGVSAEDQVVHGEDAWTHVPGLWAHGHGDWTPSPALGASHCLHPWHTASSSHVP